MLDIIICEDNAIQRNGMKKIISDEIKNFDLSIALSTGEPSAVIKYVEKSEDKCFIYFLDIDLAADINGVELAKNIRKIDPTGYIIFVTSHEEFTQLTFKYKVQALDYIVKSSCENMADRVRECIVEVHNQYKNINNKEDKVISINSGNNIIKIKLEEILFFETTDKEHKIRIHTPNEQVEFYGTLKEIGKKVSSDYYKCHRSFLVNTKNIKSIDKDNLIVHMINGETCFVSKLYLKGLVKKCTG